MVPDEDVGGGGGGGRLQPLQSVFGAGAEQQRRVGKGSRPSALEHDSKLRETHGGKQSQGDGGRGGRGGRSRNQPVELHQRHAGGRDRGLGRRGGLTTALPMSVQRIGDEEEIRRGFAHAAARVVAVAVPAVRSEAVHCLDVHLHDLFQDIESGANHFLLLLRHQSTPPLHRVRRLAIRQLHLPLVSLVMLIQQLLLTSYLHTHKIIDIHSLDDSLLHSPQSFCHCE